VLLIHAETVFLLDFAAPVIRFRSSALILTTRARAFASPFGSFGRPIFGLVCFAMFREILNDNGLDGGLWGYDGWDMQHGNVALRVRWIVRLVNPGIHPVSFRMAL
jgi:hypothetical protein